MIHSAYNAEVSDIRANSDYNTAQLQELGENLRHDFPADRSFAPGPVRNMLKLRQADDTEAEDLRAQPLWHTTFTNLYEIMAIQCEAWYPGGPIATASQHLELRPKDREEPKRKINFGYP
jgi:hypothetical protein